MLITSDNFNITDIKNNIGPAVPDWKFKPWIRRQSQRSKVFNFVTSKLKSGTGTTFLDAGFLKLSSVV